MPRAKAGDARSGDDRVSRAASREEIPASKDAQGAPAVGGKLKVLRKRRVKNPTKAAAVQSGAAGET
jgi:hypothetical protein